jgi:hypothetical protein
MTTSVSVIHVCGELQGTIRKLENTKQPACPQNCKKDVCRNLQVKHYYKTVLLAAAAESFFQREHSQ